MTAAALTQLGESGHQPHGWMASALLHGVVLAMFILVFSELKPASQPEPFHWEIALAQVAPVAEAQPVPQPPQRKPVVQPPVPTPARPVETHPVIHRTQVVQRIQAVPQIVQQEEQLVQHQTNPVVESVTHHAETLYQQMQTVHTSEPVQSVITSADTPVEAPSAISQIVSTPAGQAVPTEVSQPVQTTTNIVATQALPVQQSTVAQQQAAEVAPVETIPVESAAAATQVTTVPTSTSQAIERPAAVTASTKADYSWLTQELLSRLEQSKRYPYAARMNRWEGKVVVKAVVRNDGQVVSLQIAETSGHAVLDNDAMELIRQVSPIHLKHPLGQNQVALLVPVGYSLH